MQIKADQVAAHLRQGIASLKPIYTLFGDDPLLTQEAADAIRSVARSGGYDERQVFVMAANHSDWSALHTASQSLSLFSSQKLIEIRIPSGKPGKEGSEALQRYCQKLNPDVCTLVHLPHLNREQINSSWFTALDQAGVTVRVDPIERKDLPQWIAKRLSLQGQSVPAGDEGLRILNFFADCTEGNLLAAHQEIQKLELLYAPGLLSFEQVESAVLNVARFDVFKLSEAVMRGQSERAMRMLSGLQAEGEGAVLVHWALAEDVRALWRARDALDQGKPIPLILRENRIWGPKERLFAQLLPQLKPETAQAMLLAARICEGIIKGLPHPNWPSDPWLALRYWISILITSMHRLNFPL